jgi:hypothetical protein
MGRFVLHPEHLHGKGILKLQHLIRYRNTFYKKGEDPAQPSAYLDVMMRSDQARIIGPDAFNISEREMLQDSALQRGLDGRHKIAARTLNQAGLLNGKATLLTSDESVAAVKNFLQLSASLEEVRGKQAEDAAKKQQEQAAAQLQKDGARQQKAADSKAAVHASMVALLGKPPSTTSRSPMWSG